MTRHAVEDLGRGLLILDADNTKNGFSAPGRDAGPANASPKPKPAAKNGASKNGASHETKSSRDANGRSTDIRATLGERLKLARESKGMSAADVAEVLKFKECDVVALEEGNIDGFAPVYAVGYVRTYADFLGEKALGANVAEAVAQFRDEHFKPSEKVYEFPNQEEGRRIPKMSLVIGTAIMALGCYLIWQFVGGGPEAAEARGNMAPGAYQTSDYRAPLR